MSQTKAQLLGPVHGTVEYTGDQNFHSGTLFVDATNARVGFGTISPATTLTVKTESSNSNKTLRITDDVGLINIGHWDGVHNRIEFGNKPNLIIGYGDGNYLALGTGGEQRLHITSTGNVGIGTTDPQQKLHVANSSTEYMVYTSTGNLELHGPEIWDSPSYMRIGASYDLLGLYCTDTMHFNTSNTGGYVFGQDGVGHTYIKANGNVGINASTFPANGKNIKVSDDTISRLVLEKTGTNARNFEIGSFGTGLNVYDVTADVERLRITSGGFIGINHQDPKVGLSINAYGTQPVPNSNTYTYPAGKWSTVWNTTTADNTDYWCGFAGGYQVSNATVNISLAPNVYNFNAQAGIYIAGEATSQSSADFTIGKIIGGSVAGVSDVAGTQRATKSEMFRITSTNNVGIGTTDPNDKLHVYGGRLVLDNALASQSGIQFNSDNSEMAVLYRPANLSNEMRLYLDGPGDMHIWTSLGAGVPGYQELRSKVRIGASFDYGSDTVLNVAPGVIKFDNAGQSGGILNIDQYNDWYINNSSYPYFYHPDAHNDEGFNYSDVRAPQAGMGGWVYLGTNQNNYSPYSIKYYKIADHDGAQGTRVYQIWHDGDANYHYGGLYEIRLNGWGSTSTRFESVAFRCVNGDRTGLELFAYNANNNGIWIRPSNPWGNLWIRKAGWDDWLRSRGASKCAVDNNGPLAEASVDGTAGTLPSGYYAFYPNAGYYIENGTTFNG